MKTMKLLMAVCAAVLSLSACQTVQTTRGGTVGVEREQHMFVSAAQVDNAAR